METMTLELAPDATEETAPFAELGDDAAFEGLFDDVSGPPPLSEGGVEGERLNPFLRVAYGRKLLDFDQERELGRRLTDARLAMARGLAAFPQSFERLIEAWQQALAGERSPGDVLQWPSGTPRGGPGSAEDDASSRERMAALQLRFECRQAQQEPAGREQIPLDLRQMFVEVAPAFCFLSELRTVARAWTRELQTSDFATVTSTVAEIDAAELRFQSARRVMFESNLRLVFSIAGRFVNNGMAYDDLVQEGSIGLLRAIEKFDPDLGFKFSTYASTWIWQAVTRAIANQRRTVRVPAHIHDKMLRVRRVASDLESRSGRPPSARELAEETGFSTDVVARALNAANRAVSLDAPMREGGDATFLDATPDAVQPDVTVHEERMAQLVRRLLADLPGREAMILSMRMGLDGREPQTLEDIGALLGITRERTRQLQNRALSVLRQRLKDAGIGPA